MISFSFSVSCWIIFVMKPVAPKIPRELFHFDPVRIRL